MHANMRKFATIASLPIFILAARFIPFDKLPSTCPFLRLTGYPCPTCGMTRSTIALVHANLSRSIAFNPMGLVFAGLLALWWVNAVYGIATGRHTRLMLWARHRLTYLAVAGIVMLFAFGGLRIWCLSR